MDCFYGTAQLSLRSFFLLTILWRGAVQPFSLTLRTRHACMSYTCVSASWEGKDGLICCLCPTSCPAWCWAQGELTGHPGPLIEPWDGPPRSRSSVTIAYTSPTGCRAIQTFSRLETQASWASSCPSGRPVPSSLMNRPASPCLPACLPPAPPPSVTRTAFRPLLGSALTSPPPVAFQGSPLQGTLLFTESCFL